MEETLPKSEIVGVPYFHSAQNSEFTMQRKKFTTHTNSMPNAQKGLFVCFFLLTGTETKKNHTRTPQNQSEEVHSQSDNLRLVGKIQSSSHHFVSSQEKKNRWQEEEEEEEDAALSRIRR
jgi:hypothetical protein